MAEWTPPHLRRIPTEQEVKENLKHIRELNDKISDLKSQIAELETDRDTCTSFISPFRCLPPEILGDIALYALDGGDSPLQLAQVCSATREAVLGFKQLWNKILIQSSTYPAIYQLREGRLFCNNIKWLQFLLRRSDPCPMSISLWEPNYIMEQMQELVPVSKRIEHLHIISTTEWAADYPTFDLTELRSLAIFLSHHHSHDIKLLDLLPLKLVACFKLIIHASWNSIQKILRHRVCSTLVHAEIGVGSSLALNPDSAKVHIPVLQTLKLDGPTYLFNLTLPSLQTLSIRGDPRTRETEEDERNASILFMEDIPESISHLKIHDVVISARTLQSKFLPNLSILEISGKLNVHSESTPRIDAPRLVKVTIFQASFLLSRWIWQAISMNNVYLRFFGSKGLLGRSPIKYLCLNDTHDPRQSSTLLDPAFLPELSSVELRNTARLVDRETLETLRHDFLLRRPSVRLMIS